MTDRYSPALYPSPIALPEGRSGGVYVKHSTIEGKVTVISARQAFLRGLRPTVAHLPEPRRVHTLGDDEHGTWMTDLPEELNQIAEMLYTVNPQGHVLVGGLGLGILAKALSERDGVNSVTVVERSEDVIKLCRDSNARYDVVHDDIRGFLASRAVRGAFHYYLLDTWQGTGEAVWWEEVMPLRRTICNRHGANPVIHCWAEEIMWGQIVQSLSDPHNPADPRKHWYYKGLPKMTIVEARRFCTTVGTRTWERRYGATVDATIKEIHHEAARTEAVAAG